MREQWRPVVGWDGLYKVSNKGRVKGRNGAIMSPSRVGARGHLKVVLRFNGQKREVLVGQLVAEAFIGPRPEGWRVMLLNENPADVSVGNLKYATVSEIVKRQWEGGTRKPKRTTRRKCTNCESPVYARGWCSAHYEYHRSRGELHLGTLLSTTEKCTKDHPRTGENTYQSPQGFRFCRICRKEWGIEYRNERLSGVSE